MLPTLRACIHSEWLIRHAGAEALQGEHSGQRHGSKHLRAMCWSLAGIV